jgi:YceI-like domain
MVDGPRIACAVFVFREGAFAAMGHDLELQVTDFDLEIGEGSAVNASCRTDSLRVVGVLRQGDTDAVDESQPSAGDRQGIERDVARDILEADKYPRATFRSTKVEPAGDGYRVTGLLDLHGAVREVTVTAQRRGDRAVARFTLNQPDYRIKPYRAFLGALRVKPEVVVEVSAPWPPTQAAGEARS